MQNRKIRWYVWFLVLFALIGSVTVVTGELISRKNEQATDEKSISALEKVRLKFAAINSVHIAAEAKISIYGENPTVGRGSFEYWAQGPHQYRINCQTDKNLKLNTDLDVAYDGQRYQVLDLRSGMLSFGSQDDFRSHMALPNPFFLPLEFLSIDDEDCILCRLRFSDLKSQNERWKSRAKAVKVKLKQFNNNNTVDTLVEMPGGKARKRPFTLRLKMNGPDEENMWPVQTQTVGPEGQVLVSVEFKSFVKDSPLQVPRDILITVFDDKGNVELKLEYTVNLLELNKPLPIETFKISLDDTEAVWDSDNRKFLKEKRPKSFR